MTIYILGKFTVHEALRKDNPAWPQYAVYLGHNLIGKSFSRPDLSCCQWLERTQGVYAKYSAPLRRHSQAR